jgi:hypothetical protein
MRRTGKIGRGTIGQKRQENEQRRGEGQERPEERLEDRRRTGEAGRGTKGQEKDRRDRRGTR